MNLEQIEAFLYVSLTGNFTKAGEILYISQPTVSARIKSLEDDLGFKLFNRNGNSFSLTKEGEIFLPYARQGIENIQSGLNATRQVSAKAKGELSICTVLSMSNHILPILLKKFYEQHPNIRLTIHSGHSHHVLDMVLNYEVPLGIVRSTNHPDIDSIQLVDDEIVLATYPEHPFSKINSINIKDIADEPLILFNRGTMDWSIINNAFQKLQFKPNVVLETDNFELVKQMVKKKMGIGLLPRSSIDDELIVGNLKVTEINDFPQLNRPFQLIYLKNTKFDGIPALFKDSVAIEIPKIVGSVNKKIPNS